MQKIGYSNIVDTFLFGFILGGRWFLVGLCDTTIDFYFYFFLVMLELKNFDKLTMSTSAIKKLD